MSLLEKIKALNNGARFYTADLHIHSHGGSEDVADESMTAVNIVEKALANGIEIIAITDHNNHQNVEEAVDYATRYTGQILVVPGVEVTTAHGHLLAYFDPANPQQVNDFLGKLALTGKRGGRDTRTSMSMADVIREAEQLGGICVAAHIDRRRTGFEAIDNGYPGWKKDILLSTGLYGLELDEADNLKWYSADDDKTPAGNERRKLFAERANVSGLRGRARLAAVQGSDAHSLEAFASATSRPLTRFKMTGLSFDGLRTALVDPEARVRAIAEVPRYVPRIIGVSLIGGFLDGTDIHFNNNLNCFIGGRGTGKSTALQSIGFGLGVESSFAMKGNCPDRVVVYCEGEDGVPYQFQRGRNDPQPRVRAREDGAIQGVPADVFPVEIYTQGALSEVAKDPLKNPRLLLDFLDQHLHLSELKTEESSLLAELEQNATQLAPLEHSVSQLESKVKKLEDLDKKIKVAEEGKLKALVKFQTKVAAERSLSERVGEAVTMYEGSFSFDEMKIDFDAVLEGAGELTGDQETSKALSDAREVISGVNSWVDDLEASTKEYLLVKSEELKRANRDISARLEVLDEKIAKKRDEFRSKGLQADTRVLDQVLTSRAKLFKEIEGIRKKVVLRDDTREQREQLLVDLGEVRRRMLEKRKSLARTVNQQLSQSIEDYTIVLYYEEAGIVDEYKELLLEVLRGTYFADDTAQALCEKTTPQELAGAVKEGDLESLVSLAGERWAPILKEHFSKLERLFELEVVHKPRRPVLKVTSKSQRAMEIPVTQLSDGQKHTILLAIAMLSESRAPLVIDQPEDDLDNAFTSASVVRTLRRVKERRQVILVTHNANIAVLADSELILPMRRGGDSGETFQSGSIDQSETRSSVQEILEGGETAFMKRKEIYGH